VYWDYERGQILISGWRGVVAFDMLTGAGRYQFTATPGGYCGYGGCWFSVSDDRRILFIDGEGGLGVWNLDTLEHGLVAVRLGTAYVGNRVALSPDGRYLVVTRAMIRVWDLWNLPEKFNDRDPVYNWGGPAARVNKVRFVDATTIETDSADGVQRWDILTGSLLSAVSDE
jgi:hypothetical protein